MRKTTHVFKSTAVVAKSTAAAATSAPTAARVAAVPTTASITNKGWLINRSPSMKKETPPIATEYLAKVLTSQVYEAAIETPLTYAAAISGTLKNDIYLKREDTQPVFSFKIRGAYNKIAKLSAEQRTKGVVTCSAGNHAQGVAMSAAKLKINATIVMPLATPAIKVNAVRRLGGETVQVKLHGQNYDEAAAEAKRLQTEQGLTLVHPFDDPDVIAGQGTVGMEILKVMNGKPLDAIFACVGGGGLLSGIAAYVKAVRPDVKVIGVEADDAAGMTESLRAGTIVTLPHVGLFADGAAVKTVGKETFSICKQLVDEMITVETDEICAAIKTGFNETRCVLEPAGALAIAGMLKYIRENDVEGGTFVAISSGANMDFDRLRFVSERADSAETLIAVTIPERPGSFRELHAILHPRNITEFSYRHNGSPTANVIVSFQGLAGRHVEDDKDAIHALLSSKGFELTDLSGNEMAKSHARHLAGGRRRVPPPQSQVASASFGEAASASVDYDGAEFEELLYRFIFPESPGALNRFLDTIEKFNNGWSISLFHYRNHGHDFGRVLVGMLVKPSDRPAFDSFLENLGYEHHDETTNTVYTQFLL
jgi:threonine dehydratase